MKYYVIIACSILLLSCGKGDSLNHPGKQYIITANTKEELKAQIYDLYQRSIEDKFDVKRIKVVGNITALPSVSELYQGYEHVDYPYISCFIEAEEVDISETKIGWLQLRSFPYRVKSIALPETLISMTFAFGDLYVIKEITIPKNVVRLEHCFYNNRSLERINILAEVPPAVIYDTEYPSSWILKVPPGRKFAYANTEWWSSFSSIIE